MNFLFKTIVFVFTAVSVFWIVILVSRWGQPALEKPVSLQYVPSHNNQNYFNLIGNLKQRINDDLEKDWKKAEKLKNLKNSN